MSYSIKVMMGKFYGVFEGDVQIAMFLHEEHARKFIELVLHEQ